MLTPPEGYGAVEDGICEFVACFFLKIIVNLKYTDRCSSISALNFAFLETLGLHSIVVLNLDRPPNLVVRHCADRSVELVHMGLRPWRRTGTDWMVLSRELLMDALTYVLDTRNHPVLVLDATHAFIGAMRRAQQWSYASVLSEYRSFAGEKPHYLTELFLELLDVRFMDHEEALRRRQSVESMAAAAVAAAAVAASSEHDNQQQVPLRTHRPSMPSEDMYSDIISHHPQNNQIVVILPAIECLPDWFKRQQALWERDQKNRIEV